VSATIPAGRPFHRLRASRGYDLAMRTLGALWFLTLAVAVAVPDPHAPTTAPHLAAKACVVAFYIIMCALLLSRPPAKAQADGAAPRVAAFVGTYLPWTMAFLAKPTGSAALNLASAGFVLVGMTLTLVAVMQLGRAFSLVPQARKVVREGPYRWLRHPLYFAEELAVLGTMLQFLSPLTMAIFLAHVTVQICRIHYEEDLLRRTFPEYGAYAAGNWRLLPFVW
jgi:protein-S-isoprenylcysteine O-methyltransferase Ste14